MNPTDFRAPEAGRVIRARGGYHAFIPAPLPPKLTYDDDLVLALSQADAALSELSGLGRHLPNPHLLIAPYVRREAVLSSRIEGTTTSLGELLREEVAAGSARRDPDDVREVRNYVRALEHGIPRLRSLPLSLRLVRELHERLMRGVRGEYATPGEFRRSQNWIGVPRSTVETAVYVPPPPEHLMEVLGAWERFLQDRGRTPDLVQCALMHEQFEAIHPFLDGNGRVGRLLISLFLIERGRLSQPLLYLSAYFEEHRREYYDGLQRVRTDGDWTGWIRFFLAGVEQISREAVAQAGRLMDLRERWRARLADRPKTVQLVDALLVNPYMSVARAQRLLEVSNPTARQAVARLEKLGLLTEVTGRDWRRLYLAKPILRVLENARMKRDTRAKAKD
ncbi:MAG: cell filamentation protein Fic [Candidatus Rokuibacteriota bacterium]|nr:MAG: cell filamentation protein Fic [Candidatus Rokubacteria bacterium]